MNDLEDNPYASPREVGNRSPKERSMVWQHDVGHAVKLVPWAIGYHLAIWMLIFTSLAWEYSLVLAIAILAGMLIYTLAFVYHAWFGGLLYGRVWGVLLAFLANSGVGLLALAMFYNRARRELTSCGWQVHGFAASAPAKTG